MKHIRPVAALIAAVLLLAALAGCTAKTPTATEPAQATAVPQAPATTDEPAAPQTPADESVTLTDMTGREIALEAPATRVVALTASDCEILYAIGAGETLVGRGEYCDYPAEVTDVPAVQSGADTNIEQIIALAPQVLLMSKMAQTEEQVAQLSAAGIEVVVSDAQDIAGVYTAIAMIGHLTGRDDAADALILDMQSAFAGISANAPGDGTETVYFEVSPLAYGLWTAGEGTFMNEVAALLGLKNCFADVSGWAAVSEEQVLSRNPDYIVTISMYYGEGPTPVEEILARPGWETLTAIQNNAILNLTGNELSRPGPRLADGAQLMYEFVCQAEAMGKAA